MSRWNRALVTGASSGIGEAIARQLASEGTALVLVARSTDLLEALAAELPVDVEVLTADLADETSVGRVAARIEQAADAVDLVVNNAGLGFIGDFAELDYAKEKRVLDVNVGALHRLSHAAAGTFTARGGGAILNIASVAAFLPAARSATYAATKSFVTTFSEGLHQELEPKGVTVTVSCPGFTRTEFQDRADYDASDIPDRLWQDAATVARLSLDATAKGRARVITGGLNKIGAGIFKVLPVGIMRPISRRAAGSDR